MSNGFGRDYFRSQLRDEEDTRKHAGTDGTGELETDDYKLQHVYYVNSFNETVAATWDLQAPDQHEKSVVSQVKRRKNEILGGYGDRRRLVERRHFAPGGKYRGICKLFMGFEATPGVEYMGTGWLIARDLLVTAAHCLFDNNGGLLKYIKVYIGYEGPKETAERRNGCQLRFGKVASLPAEYIKTIGTVHDVGFVQLEKPFDDASFMKYDNTPDTPTMLRLGVVGYPGDVDGGDHMYEHWADTKVDIATNRYLTYEIDTTGGESGSPVIVSSYGGDPWSEVLAAVGVHVAGGYPNEASAIGPLGNAFEDYVTAINMKRSSRQQQPLAANGKAGKIIPVESLGAARNFEYMVIPPRAGRRGVASQMDPSPCTMRHRETVAAPSGFGLPRTAASAARNPEASACQCWARRGRCADGDGGGGSFRHVEALIGWRKRTDEEDAEAARPRGPFRAGPDVALCTRLPERLPQGFLEEHARESAGAPPARACESCATDRHPGVDASAQQTVFFVGLADEVPQDMRARLGAVKTNVACWQAWATSVAERILAQKAEQGRLGGAAQDNGAATVARRSSYRAMVLDALLRQSTWLKKTGEDDRSWTFRCSTGELHAQLMGEVLKGLSVPSSVYPRLEAAVKHIAEEATAPWKYAPAQKCQYWIMIARYRWEPFTQRVEPSIRTIGFQTCTSMSEYSASKNRNGEVRMAMDFKQQDYSIVNDVFERIQEDMDGELVDRGAALMKGMLSLDVEVPPV